MKKIRLLALLLAILMIPFSVLFACKPDEDPDNDDDEDDDKDKDNTKQEVVLERDDDNELEDGDLLNYHFNAAAVGRFPALKYSDDLSYMDIQREPYVTNFAPAMGKTGAVYRIEKKIDPTTNQPMNDGCMLIKREKTEIASDPFVDILVEGAITGLRAQHMLQFDIRLEKGLMTSEGYVGLRKELSGSKKFQQFLYIQNGALYDCNNKLIYGEPSEKYEEGWHTVSILLNDEVDVECYDVYVDGIKVAASVKYSVEGFWNYDEAKPQLYRISLGSGKGEEYLYIDNLKICNGTAKNFGLNNAPSDIIGGTVSHDHTKGTQKLTFNPTCEEDGYEYYECTECGEHLKEDIIQPTGHDMLESMDWTTLTRTAICKNCGSVENTYFFDKLISAQEKIALYQIPDNQTFSYDSFDGKEPYAISGFNVINLKNSGTFTPFSENGVTGYEFARVDTDNPKQMRDAYFDILPGQRSAPYGIRLLAGRSFTFEMDLMLGKKGRGGVYPKWTVSMKDRGPDAGDIALFTMDENGNFAFTNTDFTMPLSETEFTNIAFYVEPQSNKIQLYVNGYFKAEKQMYSTAATAMKFMFCDTRFGYSGFSDDDVKKTEDELKKMSVYQTYANEAGGSFKFNNIMYYYSAGPGCSINPEFLERAEYSGDIELQDELFNAINFSPLNVKLCDVIAKLPAGVVTTKYVMEFKLTANNLNAGTLLEGWKTNAGISHYESLLYVGTDGKLYTVGDRLVSETCNVNIALAFDDIFGTVTVYVNGVELYNGTVSYTNDMYADDEAVITGFIFKKDRGAYQISDFSLYTGTALK